MSPAEEVLQRVVNVRCMACQRSLVGVVCTDTLCMKRADCGMRPIEDMRTILRASIDSRAVKP